MVGGVGNREDEMSQPGEQRDELKRGLLREDRP
jgi:hypothetical protein